MNKVILTGRLTQTPELKKTNSGTSVVQFSVAVRRNFKNADGEYDTDFINCVAWRQTAELIAKYFAKGDGITVSGAIQTRKYTAKDGSERKAVEVVVGEIEFPLTRNNGNGQNNTVNKPSDSPNNGFTELANDDDLPF